MAKRHLDDTRLKEVKREDMKLIQTLSGQYDVQYAKETALVFMDYVAWTNQVEKRIRQNALRVVQFTPIPRSMEIPELQWRDLLLGISGVVNEGRVFDKCELIFQIYFPWSEGVAFAMAGHVVGTHFTTPRPKRKQGDDGPVTVQEPSQRFMIEASSRFSSSDLVTPENIAQIIEGERSLLKNFKVNFGLIVTQLATARAHERKECLSLEPSEVR